MEYRKVECAAEALFKDILEDKNKNLFKTKYVFVPSLKMESYLKSYYLKKYDGVLMNVKFVNIKTGLSYLFNGTPELANNNKIKSITIKYLNEHKSEFDYLCNEHGDLYGIKLFDYSNQLVSLFNEYEDDCEEYDKVTDKQDPMFVYKEVLKKLGSNNSFTLNMLYHENDMVDLGKIYVFGFTKLSKLEEAILNRYEKYELYKTIYVEEKRLDEKIQSITKAPSRLREIDNLHSKICEILQQDKNATFSDFLVLSTDMSNYEIEIMRVFNQEDTDYPNIPYYFNANRTINNNSYNLFSNLFEIIKKVYFNRVDFNDIITNPITKYIRDIEDKDVDYWINSIENLNVYRCDGWDYIRQRLLTSILSDINDDDSIVDFGNCESLPYTTVGLDKDSICKCIQVIDDLKQLIDFFNNNKTINDEKTYDDLKELFKTWLSIIEYGAEKNSYYAKICVLIDEWKNSAIFGLPINTLLFSISALLNKPRNSVGNMFSSGVSFTNFDDNFVLPAKYVFIIGASSSLLPVVKTNNSLDRRNKEISYSDEIMVFKSTIFNLEKLFISFVYRDLVTDEEFFLSNFVKVLFNHYGENEKNPEDRQKAIDNKINKLVKYISIDEERPWDEIYTNKASRNKKFKQGLFSNDKDANITTTLRNTQNEQKSFKIKDLADFLTEPLSFKTTMLIGKKGIDSELKNIFEPFEIGYGARADLLKRLVISGIQTGTVIVDDSYFLENDLPQFDDLKDEVINNCSEKATQIIAKIEDNNMKPEILHLHDYTLDKYTIICDRDILCARETTNKIHYYPIKYSTVTYGDILLLYVASLIEVAIYGGNREIDLGGKYSFTVDSIKAIETLKKICENINDYSDNKFFCLVFYEKDENDEYIIQEYKDVVSLVEGEHSEWGYFESAGLYNKYTDLGYDPYNFKKEFDEIILKFNELILFI